MIRGIGNPRIEEAFHEYLPAGTILVPAPWDEYVAFALQQPSIQAQIETGIYNVHSLKEELLSVAWAWSEARMVAVCQDLIRWHMADVPLTLAHAYCQAVAIHEAHHIEHHVDGCNLQEQAEREIECNQALEEAHPEIASLAQEAMELSPTIRKVMDRCRAILAIH